MSVAAHDPQLVHVLTCIGITGAAQDTILLRYVNIDDLEIEFGCFAGSEDNFVQKLNEDLVESDKPFAQRDANRLVLLYQYYMANLQEDLAWDDFSPTKFRNFHRAVADRSHRSQNTSQDNGSQRTDLHTPTSYGSSDVEIPLAIAEEIHEAVPSGSTQPSASTIVKNFPGAINGGGACAARTRKRRMAPSESKKETQRDACSYISRFLLCAFIVSVMVVVIG